MKLCTSYSNCQGAGLVWFLKKSRMRDGWVFKHFNNFQILLGEQTPEDLMDAVSHADIFVYQETPALKYGMLSTEEMCVSTVPKDCRKISFGTGFNDGVFPCLHHGSWRTSKEVIALAKSDPTALLAAYDANTLNFDCARRFIACLDEQRRREETVDIRMADFVLSEYRNAQLFICENHPASAYFSELARRFLKHVEPAWEESIPYDTPNDANLPCGLLVAPQVVCELGLNYGPEPRAVEFFRGKIEELIASMK